MVRLAAASAVVAHASRFRRIAVAAADRSPRRADARRASRRSSAASTSLAITRRSRIRPAPPAPAAPAVAKARAARCIASGRARFRPRVSRSTSSAQEVPDVRADAAIIYNPETNQVLWESNAQDQRSIASITKVMTALVFLESRHAADDAGHRAAHRRLSRVDDLSARRLQRHRRRPAQPAAHRIGQRRGARAGARVAVRRRRASSIR